VDPAATSGAFANRLCSQCNEIWLEAFPRLPDGRPIDGAPQSVAKITAIAIKTKHAGHLVAMSLLAVTWDAEICNLPWDWEVQVRKLGTSVFIVPGWQRRTNSILLSS